jgi:uncharacterized protein (TIGR00369 family)
VTEKKWDMNRILPHFAAHLPVAALFGIEVVTAEPDRSRVRLVGNAHITRPGGSIAGPVLFAMADLATYALTLALKHEESAVTASLLINFLRLAYAPPLIAEAVPLRAGRSLLTYDVRIWSEAEGPERLIAQATATWAAVPAANA